jgi:hypothetical protein
MSSTVRSLNGCSRSKSSSGGTGSSGLVLLVEQLDAVGVEATGCSATLSGVMAFPIGLSNGPPGGGKAPSGRNGLAEVADAGVNLIRTGRGDWNVQQLDAQIAAERALLDGLASHGLHGWTWLGDLANLPSGPPPPQAQQLARVADGLQGHPALAAYKGVDERTGSAPTGWCAHTSG